MRKYAFHNSGYHVFKQITIPKLCERMAAFFKIYSYLCWFKNNEQPIFCVYKLHLRLRIVLLFIYLEFARGSPDGATEHLRSLGHQMFIM